MHNRLFVSLLLVLSLATCAAPPAKSSVALPSSDVTLMPDLRAAGTPISEEFAGFSFETRKLLPDDHGRYYFDNTEMVSLFKSLGVKSLRIGGNTADRATVAIPTNKDLDVLYAFAKAADVQVIYNLRLKNVTDPTDDIRIAKYIMSHYRNLTSCFTLGNEPDFYYDDFGAYLAQYKKFSEAILAQVPTAKFCGPSTAGKQEWAVKLADAVPRSELAFLSLHTYPGGNAQAAGSPPAARAHILSPDMETFYQGFYKNFAPELAERHLGFRLEEANSLYNGGASNISNSYASALWALDFMYWWAGHGALGVNFHTATNPDVTSHVPGGYDAFWIPAGGIKLHPISYALKTFNVGSHGEMIPLTATTALTEKPNYSAYAARNKKGEIYLTVMNRSSAPALRDLSFTIDAGRYGHAEVLPLVAPRNDAAALEGLTLGGAPIGGDGAWDGKWTPLPATGRPGAFLIQLPATSAVVVKLTR
jgi:hypothetical protein